MIRRARKIVACDCASRCILQDLATKLDISVVALNKGSAKKPAQWIAASPAEGVQALWHAPSCTFYCYVGKGSERRASGAFFSTAELRKHAKANSHLWPTPASGKARTGPARPFVGVVKAGGGKRRKARRCSLVEPAR